MRTAAKSTVFVVALLLVAASTAFARLHPELLQMQSREEVETYLNNLKAQAPASVDDEKSKQCEARETEIRRIVVIDDKIFDRMLECKEGKTEATEEYEKEIFNRQCEHFRRNHIYQELEREVDNNNLDFIRQCREVYKVRGFRGHREIEKPMLLRDAQMLVDHYQKIEKYIPEGQEKKLTPLCVECFVDRCFNFLKRSENNAEQLREKFNDCEEDVCKRECQDIQRARPVREEL